MILVRSSGVAVEDRRGGCIVEDLAGDGFENFEGHIAVSQEAGRRSSKAPEERVGRRSLSRAMSVGTAFLPILRSWRAGEFSWANSRTCTLPGI